MLMPVFESLRGYSRVSVSAGDENENENENGNEAGTQGTGTDTTTTDIDIDIELTGRSSVDHDDDDDEEDESISLSISMPSEEFPDDENNDDADAFDGDGSDEHAHTHATRRLPMEITEEEEQQWPMLMSHNINDNINNNINDIVSLLILLLDWLSLVVTALVSIPTLILWMIGAYAFVGKWWAIWVFVMLLQLRLWVSDGCLRRMSNNNNNNNRSNRSNTGSDSGTGTGIDSATSNNNSSGRGTSTNSSSTNSVVVAVAVAVVVVAFLEVLVCGVVLPFVSRKLIAQLFFVDVDGTVVPEWTTAVRFLDIGVAAGWMLLVLRVGIGISIVGVRVVGIVVVARARARARIPAPVHNNNNSSSNNSSSNSNNNTHCYRIPCWRVVGDNDNNSNGSGGGVGGGRCAFARTRALCSLLLPTERTQQNLRSSASSSSLSWIIRWGTVLVFAANVLCGLSFVSHFGPWPIWLGMAPLFRNFHFHFDNNNNSNSNNNQFQFQFSCDPLDETECALPFPSFHHLREDPSTPTGYRVDLKGMPPLRGGIPFRPTFLNKLDGFSTMGPILFYMEGLKEAHERERDAAEHERTTKTKTTTTTTTNIKRLQGPESIASSVTNHSITVLVDVKKGTLVPHSAEIDYLDPHNHPLVMIFPAGPLDHNAHYAVGVIGATTTTTTTTTDANGGTGGGGVRLLPRTKGLAALLSSTTTADADADADDESESETLATTRTRTRFVGTVIPALERAAPWFSFSSECNNHDNDNDNNTDHPGCELQMLFDFVTASEESQLGPLKTVLDRTLERIGNQDHWNWKEHSRVVAVEDHDCDHDEGEGEGSLVARTVHLSLDVPSFLRHETRYSVLDPRRLDPRNNRMDVDVDVDVGLNIGEARAMVEIPCSVRNETIRKGTGKPLRAVIDYGHGLFGSRAEARDGFLRKLQNDNGYIVTAMDWRGMSRPDVPVVIRTLLGKPDLFEAVRDNLIQGFANKMCLQHFSRNGMLELEAFRFGENENKNENNDNNLTTHAIPTLVAGEPPVYAFYGISQGGILGAGYLSATYGRTTNGNTNTNLIDRGILGSPGSPFALVLTRSLDFATYDWLLLKNYYNNRHVRIALALMQMGWDSVEASGWSAGPFSYDDDDNNNNNNEEEPQPQPHQHHPPILIQAGLGDPNVPTLAAETLARAMGASLLPGNPRSVFGLSTEPPAEEEESKGTATWPGPKTTLSELLYEAEYNGLPIDNNYFGANVYTTNSNANNNANNAGTNVHTENSNEQQQQQQQQQHSSWSENNRVHYCLRWDPSMVEQIEEFVNTGRVIDPCRNDGCRRPASCE